MNSGGHKIAPSATTLVCLMAAVHALLLFGVLVLPLVGLALSTSVSELMHGVTSSAFRSAMWLSIYSTTISVALTVVFGTPLAWFLASRKTALARVVAVLVELPIVVPPAVVGVALLYTFGRRGLLGDVLASMGLSLPFTTAAVVLAQVVVSAPFYLQTATSAFRAVPDDLICVARTLGASPAYAFFRVTLPLAKSGLVAGMSLAWARALGEFGATLLFAGSLAGVSRTMPLAIYAALESDTRVAVALSLTLASMGALLLFVLRTPRVSHVEQSVQA
jgi:molybdate transport system permease protein